MLTLILGPSGSGKSVRLREELRQRARSRQRSILIVPEQFTSSTEGALYHALGDELSAYVESYSFTSLAETLLRRYGGAAVPTLSEAGRAVLVRRAMDEMMDKVVYYSRQRRSAAFCQKAAETISELKSAGIRPETLADYANAPGADKDKLGELALIFGTYETLLAQTAMDPGDRVELAAKSLDQAFFAGRTVYIDEFDTFNHSKRAMLAAMLPVADVTVSLCCDQAPDQTDDGVFSGARRVANTLKSMAASAGVPCKEIRLTQDMRHKDAPVLAELGLLLADPTYTPEAEVNPAAPAITYYKADSRQAEAKAVAAAVKARARAGVPYNKMAVICRTVDQYLLQIRYEFRLQNIPLFCDEPTTPENTAPARAIHAALDLLRGGLTTTALLRLLKTGLVDLDRDSQCALENYAYTWPLHAQDWREPFTRNPEGYTDRMSEQSQQDLQRAEEARSFLVPRVQKFMDRARNTDTATLTAQIYYFLQSLGAEETLQKLTDGLRACGDLPNADEALREWNVITELLDQMVHLLPAGEPITPADYDDLFTLLLRTTDMGHIPQSLDSVIFTTAGRMRLPETEAVFVMGLAEGEFPQTPGDTGLLSHADRDTMIALGAELPDCFENRVIREQVCFYKALTVAQKYLWLSWPGGAAGLPGTAALAPALELLRVPPAVVQPEELAATPAAALDLLGDVWQQNTPQRASVQAALAAVEGSAQAAPGYAAVQRAAQRKPARVEDVKALESILGPSVRISPTRFERYISCPFAYFMQYVLGARPRQKAELAPNISGTLTHWVLEQALRREGSAFAKLTQPQLEQLVESLVQEYTAANLPGAGVRMNYLLGRIQRNLVGLLGFIQRDVRQSGFQPVAFELRIDDRPDSDDPDAPRVDPVQLDDGRGHTVRIVGTVDRVDTMELGGKTYIRVVDYKTGSKKFDLREVYYGLDCQMLLYLFTLERNGGHLFSQGTAAGVEYLWADPAPENIIRPETDDAEPSQAQNYPLEGLLLDEPSIYHAMDTRGTGAFVPLSFSAKTGEPTAQSAKARLADREKFNRIRDHLDGMLTDMAKNLYSGEIDAAPLVPNAGKSPCLWCEYRTVCRHADGEGERTPLKPDDPFGAE